MRSRRILLSILSLLICAHIGCAPRDLRPEPLAETTTLPEDRVEKGRALLQQMLEAHGGLDAWRAHGNVRVTFQDRWPNALTRAAVMPWPESGATLQQEILIGTETSRITFMDGDWVGKVWGIQDWVTYHVEPGGEPVVEGDKDIWFWLPTTQYFFEAPFRLREGQYVAHAGTQTIHGKTYDLVYITWGSVEPSKTIDQYVAWIEQDTRRLGILQYTVRDFGKRIQGTAHYEGYKQIQGLTVPTRIRLGDLEDKENVLHMMEFSKIEYGVSLERDTFYPAPGAKASKEDKGAAP